ncbi:hypothetical protein IF1G_04590 [Cordyceps javanica]|uniref:Fungal N-terminal domain-containing protein n=1 Tax=Cordyceps javanica TaxID=43265 RepID=A0A545V6K4_9HYPO|nr:hypothetical protein IF1G_04590 [Cordyceps javanica]TQW08587.1 tetratricopeptide repeat domain-containing protein [Cordyceps javanica]
MDPLSICASAVALIGASTAVTKALYSFTRYATHAEAHVASLCSEISTLTGFLSSINKTLKSCRHNARALALVDAELWRQSDLALQDCEATLDELSTFVARLKTLNKTSFWRAKVAVDMSIHARKLEQFRARLKRSNYALQTVLQTITVSVSLQSNASQDRILLELEKLKDYIEDAVRIANRSPVGTRSSLAALSETEAAKNLQCLAKAAECFHSSATTTVGSSLGGSVADWAPPARETASSIAGLSPLRTQLLHDYIQNTDQEPNVFAATITEARESHPIELSEYLNADESAELTENPSVPMEPTLDADFERSLQVFAVLEDFAIEKMKIGAFDAAATYLNEALALKIGRVPDTKVQMRIQTRLGICYVLQRKIPEARNVVSSLERINGLRNREVLHLMHALAMVYFAEQNFEQARALCTKVIDAKTELLGKLHPETLTSVGFMWYLYDKYDMPVLLEATRRRFPEGYEYKHPESEFDFLAQHAMLLPAIVLESEQTELPCTSFCAGSRSESAQSAETEWAPNHNLKRALTRYETQQTDTMKAFVAMTVVHADGEEIGPAPETIDSKNEQRRTISRRMTTMRRRFSSWRSSKLATDHKDQDATGIANVRRARTVLHKAPPAIRVEHAGPKGLAKAKKFLGILKTEMSIITIPTEEFFAPTGGGFTPTDETSASRPETFAPWSEIFSVFELDSNPITKVGLAKQLADSDKEQEAVAVHGGLSPEVDVLPPEPPQGSARQLNTSLDTILESPELHSGNDCRLGNRTPIVIEDSGNSSDGSISRGSSVSDNRSTASGSSYSTNTTISEAIPTSPVDYRDSNNFTVLRSLSQRHELAPLIKNGSLCSSDRSKTVLSPRTKDTSLPFIGSFSGAQKMASLLAAHRSANRVCKPCGRGSAPDTSAKVNTGHALDDNGCEAQPPDQNVQALTTDPHDGWGGGSCGETHGLKRTFSWNHGDENLFVLKYPSREPQKKKSLRGSFTVWRW